MPKISRQSQISGRRKKHRSTPKSNKCHKVRIIVNDVNVSDSPAYATFKSPLYSSQQVEKRSLEMSSNSFVSIPSNHHQNINITDATSTIDSMSNNNSFDTNYNDGNVNHNSYNDSLSLSTPSSYRTKKKDEGKNFGPDQIIWIF